MHGASQESGKYDSDAAVNGSGPTLRACRLCTSPAPARAEHLGQLEAARRDYAETARLDPRNGQRWGVPSGLLLRLGRVAEARTESELALARRPSSLGAIVSRVIVEAAAGGVPAARHVLARATEDVPRETLVARIAFAWDLGWLLDADQERLLLTLGADAFDGDRGLLAFVRAEQYGWRGDSAHARAWGDSAVREFAVQLRAVPTDPQRHVLRGLVLAYAGRGREALAEAQRGSALQGPTPESRETDTYAYFNYVAAHAALLAGERERALAWLAEPRRAHYYAASAWLRVEHGPHCAPTHASPNSWWNGRPSASGVWRRRLRRAPSSPARTG